VGDTICRQVPGGGMRMRWVLRLVGTGIGGPSISVNFMEFDRPDCLEDITNLGLTPAEGKQLPVSSQTRRARGAPVRAPAPSRLPAPAR
jgi:hypothetical protein